MNDLPGRKASICIPTYNQAQFLSACLRSALDQTYDNYEVVLSVNHCTDNTEEVVREFVDNPRLRIVRPDHFLTAGENFRFVISQARGAYINFLSSDDLLFPDFLRAQVDTLERCPNVALSFTAAELVDEHGELTRLNRGMESSYIRRGRNELKRYIFRPRATGIALLFRRDAYEALGGLQTEIVDWEMCIKLLCEGDVAYHSQVLARVRIWSNPARLAGRVQLIKSLRAFSDDAEEHVSRRYPELRPLFARARRQLALREVSALSSYGEHREQAREFVLALSDDLPVHVALLAYEHLGLEPLFRLTAVADTWLRSSVKRILFRRAYQRATER